MRYSLLDFKMNDRKFSIRVLLATLAIVLWVDCWGSATAQFRGPVVAGDQNKKPIVLYSESHALLVGISDYSNGWAELPGVLDDIHAVRSALEKHGFRVWEIFNVKRQEFDRAIRDFIGQFGQNKDNRLLIYFAGHGATLTSNDGKDRRTGYLVPADAPLLTERNAGEFKKLAISMSEVETYSREITSKHALFVFDSCFSGEFFKMRGGAVPDAILYKLDEPVRQFIAAGTEKQTVPDKSIFRRQFVTALEGEADMDCNGYVTGAELCEFLQTTVTDYTKRKQTPQHGKINDPDLDRGDIVFNASTNLKKCGGHAGDEENVWRVIANSNDPQMFRDFLQKYPNSRYSALAAERLRQLELHKISESRSSIESDQQGTWDVVQDRSVRVSAATQWTNTSIKVEAGQQIRINATGQVSLGANGYSGPDGVALTDPRKLLPGCLAGALIAKIDANFVCVLSGGEFIARASGELLLGVNEGSNGDNSGSFTVKVVTFKFTR